MKLLLKKIKLNKPNFYLDHKMISQSGKDKKKVDNNTNAADRKNELAKEEISFFLSGLK